MCGHWRESHKAAAWGQGQRCGRPSRTIFGRTASIWWFSLRGDNRKGKDQVAEIICACIELGILQTSHLTSQRSNVCSGLRSFTTTHMLQTLRQTAKHDQVFTNHSKRGIIISSWQVKKVQHRLMKDFCFCRCGDPSAGEMGPVNGWVLTNWLLSSEVHLVRGRWRQKLRREKTILSSTLKNHR